MARRAAAGAVARVVSGGQTGADRAGLDAALDAGVPIGGWCPAGRVAEDGAIGARYPLRETPSAGYRQRTEWNVRDSDATLLLVWERVVPRGGTAQTRRLAEAYGRPCWAVDVRDPPPPAELARWCAAAGARVLNVAGPRESPGSPVYAPARRWLAAALASAAADPAAAAAADPAAAAADPAAASADPAAAATPPAGRVWIGNLRTGATDMPAGASAEDVRCDRTTLLGNPFRIQGARTPGGERASCDAFAAYLDAVHGGEDGDMAGVCGAVAARCGLAPWRDPRSARYACPFLSQGGGAVRAELRRLRSAAAGGRDLRLLCHCYPQRCHTMELRRWLGGAAAGCGSEAQLPGGYAAP